MFQLLRAVRPVARVISEPEIKASHRRSLAQERDIIPYWARQFPFSRRIAGNDKRCLLNLTGDVLTLARFLSWPKALTSSD
jgi:hypothetical protein